MAYTPRATGPGDNRVRGGDRQIAEKATITAPISPSFAGERRSSAAIPGDYGDYDPTCIISIVRLYRKIIANSPKSPLSPGKAGRF